MKIEADTHATRQSMKLDQKEREYLEQTKEQIKKTEEDEIYRVFQQLEMKEKMKKDRSMPFMPKDNTIFGKEDIYEENNLDYQDIEEQAESQSEEEEEENEIPAPRQ